MSACRVGVGFCTVNRNNRRARWKTASPFSGKEAACTRVSCAERAWTAPDSQPPAEPLRGNTAATEVTCWKTCDGLETVTRHRSGKRWFEGVCAQTHTGTRPQERRVGVRTRGCLLRVPGGGTTGRVVVFLRPFLISH